VDAQAQGGRVSLRPLFPHENAQVAAWCPGYNGPADELMAVLTAEGLAGAIGYRLVEPAPGWCTLSLAVVAPERRGFGLGSEAVRALEERLTAAGVRCFRALVPESLGLAFYFWLRLGYKPDDCRDGQMVMTRCSGG